jgi:ATP-dependent exoDNAse (exonuclease V) beta subunit
MKSPSIFPHLVIRASAGTGKTYQLSNRFIGLLGKGVRPEEILATTFTRKAAGEILDRVLLRLAEAADNETKRQELAKAIGDKSLTQDHCRELLASTVRGLHRLRVGTLDSHFIHVASSFALELGLPPGWLICEEIDDVLLRDEAIELVLARGRLSDLLSLVHSLTKGTTQRGVGQLVQGTVRMLFELYRETPPEAWRQLPRHKELPAEEMERILDALASFELPTAQLVKTLQKDVEKARLGQWEELLKSGIGAKIHGGETTFNRKPLPAELVGLYRLLLKQAEAVLVGQIARQTEATHDLLARFAEHYYSLQHEERMLRFSDVTQRLALASDVARPEQMAFRLDAGIRHVLLDEFQDTSPMQWRVLRPLAQAVAGGQGSFFCVGDAKQAIYGWRGGVAAIFGALDGELRGLTHSGLDISYRSSQPVIDAVNQVFQNLTKHPNLDHFTEAVTEWQAQFPPHQTAKDALPGYVTLSTAPAAADDEDAADMLFDHAAERIAAAAQDAPAASIGVLVRTNKAVAHLIYLLRKRGVLASEEGGNPLSDSPAVELILSLLRLADHPGDSVARFHLATSPLATALELTDHRDDRAAGRLSQRLRRELLDDGYGRTIHHWAKWLADSCDQRDLGRLQQLVELAYAYQPRSTLRADQFIAFVNNQRVADPASGRVRVMTIHQAKGLEFDVVFLPELGGRIYGQREEYVAGRPGPTQPYDLVCRSAGESVRQFFPPRLAKLFDDDTKDEVTESLCVLYVAMTRAVHALHMILPLAASNEGKLPKTYAGLLRATLAAGKPATGGQTLYEHGNPAWYKKLPSSLAGEGPGASGRSAADSPPPKIQLAPPLKFSTRHLERASPSALEGGSKFRAARLLEASPDEAFALGTLVHAWLAEIEWLDAGPPTDKRLREIAARLHPQIGALVDNLDLPIANFRRWLAATPIASVLSRSFYDNPKNLGLAPLKSSAWKSGDIQLEVLREHPFAIRDGDQLLTGAIDRLVLIRRQEKLLAADLLDFKTDDLTASDATALAARTAFYQPQIDAYRRAIGRILPVEPERLGARIAFLNCGIVNAIA